MRAPVLPQVHCTIDLTMRRDRRLEGTEAPYRDPENDPPPSTVPTGQKTTWSALLLRVPNASGIAQVFRSEGTSRLYKSLILFGMIWTASPITLENRVAGAKLDTTARLSRPLSEARLYGRVGDYSGAGPARGRARNQGHEARTWETGPEEANGKW